LLLDFQTACGYDFFMPKPLRLPNASEQAVLDSLGIRLLTEPEDKRRWDQLVIERHYLKSASLVGEQLRYVVEHQGQWLALLGWSAPALHLKAREAWIGWSPEQLRRRRHFVAQNSRLVLLVDRHQLPNLATRALGLCCQRLSADWRQVHGHPIVAVESFVDSQLMFRGTVYKAAGWLLLGPTAGFGRCAEDFYERHDRPKQLWVRALDAEGVAGLKAEALPPHLAAHEGPAPLCCPLSGKPLLSLLDRLPQVPDPRGVNGRRHSWPAVLGILCLAKLAGVAGAQRDIAEFAQRLTQRQRRLLGCYRDPATGQRKVPGQSTFFRALKAVPYDAFEPVLLGWQNDVLGPADPRELVVLDGKAVRGARGQMVMSAISVPSGRVLGVELVHSQTPPLPQDSPTETGSGKENEIPAARRLLARAPVSGRLVSLDAMHTQHQTAGQIVMEAGADYLLTLKDNQPTLTQTAHTLVPSDFFPSGPAGTATPRGPNGGEKP
jgi:hypothetical protein